MYLDVEDGFLVVVAVPFCVNSLFLFCLLNVRWTPYGNTKCIICKQQVHQDAKYCHTCAYSKGKKLNPPSLSLSLSLKLVPGHQFLSATATT